MAFLDNSGDIILDAVLTDVGRQRLSQGNFSIRKFALGDDEIQYNLYDKNNPSGSAYYDLEILQTPVEVAHTRASNIQYGLISLTSPNILYIPDLALNEKTSQSIIKYNKLILLAVNQETKNKLIDSSGVDPKYVLKANDQSPGRAILVESGLDTPDVKGTAINRTTYLQSVNMMDNTFSIALDSRFFDGAWGTGNASTFTNDALGNFTIAFGPLSKPTALTPSKSLLDFNVTTVRGAPNLIYYYGAKTPDTSESVLQGPRGTVLKLNLNVPSPDLTTAAGGTRSDLWGKFGKLSQTAITGKSQKYDILDTFILITGNATGRSIQVPIRILRYVSG
jgi:hypothetical protein